MFAFAYCLVLCTSLLPPLPRFALLRLKAGASNATIVAKETFKGNSFNDTNIWKNTITHDLDDYLDDEEPLADVLLQKVQQNAIVAAFLDGWKKTPPITQSFLATSFAITFLSFMYNGNRFPAALTLQWFRVIRNFEVWRIFTNFLNFGAFDVFYALTMYILWMNMSVLEKLHVRSPEDFVTLVGFGAVSLLALHASFGITPVMLGHNLLTYMIYIWSRLFEGTDINLYGFIMKAEWLPWVYCLETILFQGAFPIADAFSIAAGHIYLYIKDAGLLKTPLFLKKLFALEFLQRIYAKFRDDIW